MSPGNELPPREVAVDLGNQDGKPKPTWTQGSFFPRRRVMRKESSGSTCCWTAGRTSGPGGREECRRLGGDVGVDVAGLTLTLRPRPGGAGAAGAVPMFRLLLDVAGRPVAGGEGDAV